MQEQLRDDKEQPLAINPSEQQDRPLTPALSPYEGERESISLALEHANDLDFRSLGLGSMRERRPRIVNRPFGFCRERKLLFCRGSTTLGDNCEVWQRDMLADAEVNYGPIEEAQ
jgi:hypothetical protein